MAKANLVKSTRQRLHPVLAAALLAVAALLLYIGYREFWLMTDDAYIAFRYVSNSVNGHGYVWNPEPFRAVEGYTSFLWIVILDVVWRLFVVEPPSSANTISFIFAFGSLVLTAIASYRMKLTAPLDRYRLLLTVLTVLGLLSNPTFLTWASSGLETALFNFCLLAWVFSVLFIKREHKFRFLAITSTAALTYLARPDGILIVLGTLLLVGKELWATTREKRFSPKAITLYIPIIIPGLHFLWRHSFYGEWLPNTYYAKQVAAWPTAGLRYLSSFVIEYGLWFWIVVIVFAAHRFLKSPRSTESTFAARLNLDSLIVIGCVLGQVGYYTLIVGGDHFEWRVYSQLIPLIYLCLVWAIRVLDVSPTKSLGIMAASIILSLPIPWSYHNAEEQITYVPLSSTLKLTVADKLPVFIAPLGKVQDQLQSWLTDHLICVRRQKHKLFFENQLRVYPERSLELPARCGKFPVGKFSTVGVAGWMLPTVNILDGYGLNDYIIARTPVPPEKDRHMAHDRLSPPHYFASFIPNVLITGKRQIEYMARRADLELTEEKIKSIEKYWESKIVRGTAIPDSLRPWPEKSGSDTTILYQ